MSNEVQSGFLLSIVVYAILFVIAVILSILYRQAYIKMKKTPVIRSVMLLMFAVSFDTLYFGVTTFLAGANHQYQILAVNPYLLVWPKILLIAALTYFLYTSLSPNPALVQRICPYKECYLEQVNHTLGRKKKIKQRRF